MEPSAVPEGRPLLRKRGRPPIPVIEEVLERRRLSRQRVNAGRPKNDDACQTSHQSSSSDHIGPNLSRPTCTTHEEGTQHGRGNNSESTTSSTSGIRTTEESRRMRTSINRKKLDFLENNAIHNLGSRDDTCGFCAAKVWPTEFTGRHVGMGPKGYSICCGKGNVQLPLLREPPSELRELITNGGVERHMTQPICNYRGYNST